MSYPFASRFGKSVLDNLFRCKYNGDKYYKRQYITHANIKFSTV
jgi:hypothetical protein